MLASGVLFGLMAVVVRLATFGEGRFAGGQASLIRFGVGALACLAIFGLRPGRFRPRNKRLLVVRGLLGATNVVLYYLALSRIPAGDATLLNSLFPILATLLSIYLIKERPTWGLASALVIASVGVWLVLGRGGLTLGLGLGEALGFASALFAGVSVVVIRTLRATDDATTIFFALCVAGLGLSWPLALGPWPALGPIWLAALGAGGLAVLAQLLMTSAYGALTVPEAAVWQQLNPVASYLWALAILDERLAPLAVVGVGLVLAGVAWGATLGPRRASPADATPRLSEPLSAPRRT